MAASKASVEIEVDVSKAMDELGKVEDSLDRIIAKLTAIKVAEEGAKKSA